MDKSKPGPVIVELDSIEYKQEVFKQAKLLRTIEEYKNKVFINEDMTPAERVACKLLIIARNEKNRTETDEKYIWIIKDNVIQRVLKRNI